MMKNIKNKHIMIIGAGRSIIDYRDKILKYIKNNDIVTIGINFMTSLCIPDYHLWTNKQRYGTQYDCINKKSKLLFGSGMPVKNIRMHYDGDYQVVNYKNDKSLPISYDGKIIYGNFRTAGILAVMVAYINGASKIDIVGMDGFTLHLKKELESKAKNHHCYGEGYTDDADWEKCLGKDKMVSDGLFALKNYGVDFRILTPTKFESFYYPEVI